ncbi:MAG: TonB family protein, partial [Acidobacteriota bacterium]
LNAYEMNPLGSEVKTEESVKLANEFSAPETVELPKTEAFEDQPETPAILSNSTFDSNEDILEIGGEKTEEFKVTAPAVTIPAVSFKDEVIEESVVTAPAIPEIEVPVVTAPAIPIIEEPIVAAPAEPIIEKTQQNFVPITTPVYQQTSASFADEKRSSNKKLDDDGFYSVTLVEEQNTGTRRLLLMGAFLFVMGGALIGLVASIYNADAFVGALDDNLNSIVFVGDEAPAEEPEVEKPKNEDKGGGGGGGGNKEPTPTSKGVLASQSEKPMIPPSAKMDKVTNPELVLKPETQGNRIEKPTNERYGDPNSKYDVASDGTGSGGGQGSGTGRGQGSGRGTGAGSGDGSGNGSGVGNGNGDGRGDGRGAGRNNDDGDPPPAIKKPVGPTEGIKILSKPRANYTDAARQNQVQGTVTLRVTFLANGSIGGISPVSGLPNGLTEQAIAAARGIRFEPAKVNGVAQTVTKQVQYSFTLY